MLKPYRAYIILFSFFIVTFILPLFFFHIPMQGAPLDHYVSMIYHHPITDYSEFGRVPVSGALYFYLIKIFHHHFFSLSLNLFFFILYGVHFIAALLLYIMIRKALESIAGYFSASSEWIALSSSLFFLVSPIAVDSYAESIAVTRNVGVIFAIGYLYVKYRYQWKGQGGKSYPMAILSALLISAACLSYEPYCIYLAAGVALILWYRKISVILFQLLEWGIFLSTYVTVRWLLAQQMTVASEVQVKVKVTIASILSHFVGYVSAVLLPNIHGKIFGGSYLIFFVLVVLFALAVKNGKRLLLRFGSVNLVVAVIFLLGIFGLFALQRAYIPRALYAILPILAIYFVLAISVVFEKIKTKVMVGLLAASVLSFWQFFYLQEDMYRVAQQIYAIYSSYSTSVSRIVVDHYSGKRTGVRLMDDGTEIQTYYSVLTGRKIPVQLKAENVDVDLDKGFLISLKDRIKHNLVSEPITVYYIK